MKDLVSKIAMPLNVILLFASNLRWSRVIPTLIIATVFMIAAFIGFSTIYNSATDRVFIQYALYQKEQKMDSRSYEKLQDEIKLTLDSMSPDVKKKYAKEVNELEWFLYKPYYVHAASKWFD